MAEHFAKRLDNWSRLQRTQKFLLALDSDIYQNPHNRVFATNRGAGGNGTWGSREVALKLAQWLSVEFEVFCIQKLDELFQTGSTSLKANLSTLDLLKKSNQDLGVAIAEIERLEGVNEQQEKELEHKQDVILDMTKNVSPKTMRAKINQICRNTEKGDYGERWQKLYTEFYYRYKINLKARAKNAGYTNRLEFAEKFGFLEDLYTLALRLFETKLTYN